MVTPPAQRSVCVPPAEFSDEQPELAGCAVAVSIEVSAHTSTRNPTFNAAAMTMLPTIYYAGDRAGYSAILPWQAIMESARLTAEKQGHRSEERRVGKECRSGWSPNHEKKKKTHQERNLR